MGNRLEGSHVLVTQADRYIGPPVMELFTAEGADVVGDTAEHTGADTVRDMVDRAGRIDILVANLAGPRPIMPVTNMLTDVTAFEDADFQAYADELVRPMLWVVRAVLPQMIDGKAGKIVGATSATPIRPDPRPGDLCRRAWRVERLPADRRRRGRQASFQINALGPAHIENKMYYTDEILADDGVRQQFAAQILAARLGKRREAAKLALALATGASDFLAGQVIPISGGWTV